jgi:hypothetical protein
MATMSNATLPAPEQIAAEIKARREELAALKKLLRASRAVSDAMQARQRREALVTARADRQEVTHAP